MSSNSSPHTLSDMMAEAVSPAFIMALVGSLVFFLVEVLYVGQYSSNLLWGLFFFVFAAVLIARISILSPAKARGYAVVLAIPVWLTLQFFVEYPETSPLADWKWAINLGLMAVIWWSAHRLTWDCTYIDEDADVSGAGLLQAAGLEGSSSVDAEPDDETKNEAGLGWWARYQRYREQRRKQHTPGVWVVYFSLAALPLFGLGQSLIPVEEESRRRYVFWLMVLYVGSGLGLLLTTTFLGLRHYLRQRQVRMPAAMTGVWLMMGGSLVVALLALGALLPRPVAEYPLVELPGIGSPHRQASQYAIKGGAPGEGEGRPGGEPPRGEQGNNGQPGNQGRQGNGQGQPGGQKPGSTRQGDQQGSGTGNQQGQQGGSRQDGQAGRGEGQGKGQDQSGGRGEGKDNSGEPGGKQGSGPRQQNKPQDQAGGRRSDQPRQGEQGKDGERQADERGQTPPQGSSPPSSSSPSILSGLSALLAALAPILKWVVFIAFIVLVAFVILRGVLQFLAHFTNWARDLLNALRTWWEALFGRREAAGPAGAEAATAAPAAPPKPFASYHNPFTDGSADQRSPAELVRYTFEAFQAWAWEHHLGRRPDETPLEFADRVGREVPGLEADAGRLAILFARVLYARGPLPANARAMIEQFWTRLEAVVEQPLSA
jgi:hypothetical protein